MRVREKAHYGIGAAVVDGFVHIPGGGPIEDFSVSAVHETLDANGLLAAGVPALLPMGLVALVAGMMVGTTRSIRRKA